MKNYLQDGDAIDIAAPADVTSGQGLLVGALFGVTGTSAGSGYLVALHIEGTYELPKTSAQAWTLGAKIYWDDTEGECTTVSTSNTFVGHAVEAAANPSATGKVRLHGASA